MEAGGGVKRAVIIVAMKQEAEPFVREHALAPVSPTPFVAGMPFEVFFGLVSRVEVFLVYTGWDERLGSNNVATTAASVATYAAIAAFRPDVVISAGTAGGLGEVGARVGDVYLSTKTVFHARRIPIRAQGVSTRYEEYGFGHFRSPPLSALAKRVGLKMGVVSTSDSLDHTDTDLAIMRAEGASVKEMEAAGCAWVALQARVPFIAVKAITDVVDEEPAGPDEFYDNLHAASEALQAKLSRVVQELGITELGSPATPPVARRGEAAAGPSGKTESSLLSPSSSAAAVAAAAAAARRRVPTPLDDAPPSASSGRSGPSEGESWAWRAAERAAWLAAGGATAFAVMRAVQSRSRA